MPIVSILTTVYNRGKYIAECIESVQASSLTDWEMIIVDDQSKDDSLAIAKRYALKDPRIKVFLNEHNLGDYPNRNQAAKYASGKYLKYIDADDTIYPHGLKIMVDAMEQHPEAYLGSQGIEREFRVPYPFIMDKHELFHAYFFRRNYFFSGPTGTIIRKDIFEQVGGFSGKRFIGDSELWIKIAMEGPVVYFQPALIWWRTHEDQESVHESDNEVPLLHARDTLFWETISHPKLPLNATEKKAAIKLYRHKMKRHMLAKLIKKQQPAIALEILRLLKKRK